GVVPDDVERPLGLAVGERRRGRILVADLQARRAREAGAAGIAGDAGLSVLPRRVIALLHAGRAAQARAARTRGVAGIADVAGRAAYLRARFAGEAASAPIARDARLPELPRRVIALLHAGRTAQARPARLGEVAG